VPALYDVVVTHLRAQRIDNAFRQRLYLWLVDLDELPRLPWWLRPFARFPGRDHFDGDRHAGSARSVRAGLDRLLAAHGVDLDGGRVLMLAQARLLGFVFNPLSVFWCHRRDGELACVVAEVHNTHGQRHAYLLRPDERGRARTDKEFYVSPFLTVAGHYRLSLPLPDRRLALSVTLRQDGGTALTASVRGERRPATPGGLVRLLLRRPLTTYRTWLMIHVHGIALWLRRLPVVPRPAGVPPRVPVREGSR
jgi:hypothetical protein